MPPVVASPGMSLEEVSRHMDQHRYHGLPVIDPRHGLVGIITVTDVGRFGGPVPDKSVAEAMTPSPVTVGPLETIAQLGIVPVLTLDRAEDAEPVAEALVGAGLPCAEVTFRTGVAAEAIERMTGMFPEMVVGAGTVLSSAQSEIAALAGASFVVGPGFDRGVFEWCRENGMPVVPGAVTPTEVGAVLSLGVTLIKFFPAEPAGGVRTLEALAGPFPDVRFLPTGGIRESNLAAYLQLPTVAACGASWVADRGLVRRADFAAIAGRAAAAVAIVAEARRSR
jgi:2-dehydro-3-deoxyphosphogluconate aldolase/(4S)-4-hydroxy-2-oxoglutarate aldolase